MKSRQDCFQTDHHDVNFCLPKILGYSATRQRIRLRSAPAVVRPIARASLGLHREEKARAQPLRDFHRKELSASSSAGR
jgi:hypothetical protein